MSDFKVRVTLREHRIVDAGWFHADELPSPGETIEVEFELADGSPPASLLARVTDVAPDQEWSIDAAEIDPDETAGD